MGSNDKKEEKTNDGDGDGVEQTSMVQDNMQAYIYPANFDTDFTGELFDEF